VSFRFVFSFQSAVWYCVCWVLSSSRSVVVAESHVFRIFLPPTPGCPCPLPLPRFPCLPVCLRVVPLPLPHVSSSHFIPRFVLVRVCSCIFGVIFGIGAGASLDMLAQASGLRMIRPFGNGPENGKPKNRLSPLREVSSSWNYWLLHSHSGD